MSEEMKFDDQINELHNLSVENAIFMKFSFKIQNNINLLISGLYIKNIDKYLELVKKEISNNNQMANKYVERENKLKIDHEKIIKIMKTEDEYNSYTITKLREEFNKLNISFNSTYRKNNYLDELKSFRKNRPSLWRPRSE